MRSLTIREYASIFGVTTDTVRKWERSEKITPRRTNGGHRRYTEDDIKAIDINVKYGSAGRIQRNIIYCRVSNGECHDELTKQIEGLTLFALGRGVKAEVIAEVGDGTCMARPKFKEILAGLLNKELATIIIMQEKRLLSNGFELLDSIAKSCGCEIIAVNNM